jgi:hypothetical protein
MFQNELDISQRLLTSKDIGFAIMSRFHYAPGTRMVTCATMEEVAVISENERKEKYGLSRQGRLRT